MHSLFNDPQLEKAVQQTIAVQLNVADSYTDLVFYFLLAQLAFAAFIILYDLLKVLTKILKKVFKVLMFILGVLINVGFTASVCLLAYFAYKNPEVIMELLKHGFKVLSESF